MNFQRAHSWRHLRTVKRICITVAAAILVLVMLTLAAGTERVGNKILFYVHVARLYTEEPDRKLAMPLKDVSKKEITDTWHAPRGSDRQHEGQDIFAPRGTPIYSATPGYVYKVGEDNLGGHTVSVIGAGGRIYYYAHLDSYAPRISVGDWVTPRTVLGNVGTTGNAIGTPPHLHFGVYATDGAINPLPLLFDRPKEKPNSASNPTVQAGTTSQRARPKSNSVRGPQTTTR
jgi:murein DD-endopeptidase MepM/ murein hydrolase activator NlpD